MKSSSRYIQSALAFLLVVAAASPLAAQVNDTYVITAAGSIRGGANTNWATELNVFNPQSYTLWISITFIPRHGTVGTEVLLELGPNENAWTDNVIEDWIGRTGSGSLLLATFPEDNPGVPDDVLSRAFLVTSRTYNTTSIGTYGQSIPGVWANGLLDYPTDGISAIVHGVKNFGTLGLSGYRTNVGAVNLGRSSVWLLVSVYDAAGNVVNDELEFEIPPMAWEQQALPVGVANGTIEFFLDDPSVDAVVFPYISTVDNRTGDAVYQNPILLADPDILFKGSDARIGYDPASPGAKIGLEHARPVRERAIRGPRIRVMHDGSYGPEDR